MALEDPVPGLNQPSLADALYSMLFKHRAPGVIGAVDGAKSAAGGIRLMSKNGYDPDVFPRRTNITVRILAEMGLFYILREYIPGLDGNNIYWNHAFYDTFGTSIVAKPDHDYPLLGIGVALGDEKGDVLYPGNFRHGLYRPYDNGRQDIGLTIGVETLQLRDMVCELMNLTTQGRTVDTGSGVLAYNTESFRNVCVRQAPAIIGSLLVRLGDLPSDLVQVPLSRPMDSFLEQMRAIPYNPRTSLASR
jgi:hypothetical protein